MPTKECENCGERFEYNTGPEYPWPDNKGPKLCPDCQEEKAMEALANVEAPEGGWPRYSDMDRI